MDFKHFILDVDGVLARSAVFYNEHGKLYKIFGPDDHDALNMLRPKINIEFVTSDKRGFAISERRVVKDMNFPLSLSSNYERPEWMRSKFSDLKEIIYMGDGIFDGDLFEQVGYSICPADGFYRTREKASHITHSTGGNRAVAEACLHILEKFCGIDKIIPNKNHGIWGQKNDEGNNK